MRQGKETGLDQTARNLLRIVTGSYFLAIALDLVAGLDPSVLFAPLLPPIAADLAGSTLLVCLSISFMLGLHLRISALSLVLFVLSSSLVQNMIHVQPGSVSAFWRDLTLTCAVMLSYLTLSSRDLRRASLLAQRARHRRALAQSAVNPRRIQPVFSQKRPIQQDIRRALMTAETAPRSPRLTEDERENVNIFANI